jgi:hypothetical protein
MTTAQETAIGSGLAAALGIAGQEVSYLLRATGETLPWTAARGRTIFETSDAGDLAATTFSGVDWIGAAAELTLGAGMIEPAAGDRILVSGQYTIEKYEVLAIPGAKPYALDPTGFQLRIHTKRIA